MNGAARIHNSQQCHTPRPVILSPIRSDVMTTSEKDIETVIPDLRDIPVDRLAELGSSALAHSIALYRERLRENGVPLSSFQARI
jgi:hypothetical protein